MNLDDLYTKSRWAFDNLSGRADAVYDLQARLAAWQSSRFPNSPAILERVTLGIGEELGELEEATQAGKSKDVEDAIGDVLVYAAQLCTIVGLDLGTVVEWAESLDHESVPIDEELSENGEDVSPYAHSTVVIGKLNHHVLKTAQGIRGYADTEYARRQIFKGIVGVCVNLQLAFLDAGDPETGLNLDVPPISVCWRNTAESVMQRGKGHPAIPVQP